MSRLRELISKILSRRVKIVFVFSVFTVLLCIHIAENERLSKYKQSVESSVKALVGRARRLPTHNHVQDLTKDDFGVKQVLENHVVWSETSPRSLPTAQNDNKTEKNLQSSVPSPKPYSPRVTPNSAKGSQIVFPDVTNCTRKTHHGSRTHDTADVYPCKSWRPPDPRDNSWPVVLAPTNGKVLKRLKFYHKDPEVQELISEQVAVQEERLARLATVCLQHPELSVRQYVTLVWDTSRRPPLIYCPIYKVASTTWMAYFLRLKHINDDNAALNGYHDRAKERLKYMPNFGGGHRRVFEEYKEPQQSMKKNQVFRKALRFLVVRHPFTRILSAYRDKIERPRPRPFAPYFEHLQQAIILKYRPTNSILTRATPTFSEFIDYVIDSTKNLKTARDWIENVVCWVPYWVQCGVCASDYQVVLKLETMATDEQFLAQVANLKELQDVHEWRNHRNSSGSSAAVLPHYYKSLTTRQIHLLYQRYRLDFDLFGYSVDEYLKFAQQS